MALQTVGRVMIFIDGSNFYSSCRQHIPHLSIDFDLLAHHLADQVGDRYVGTYYCSSLPPDALVRTENDREAYNQSVRFFDALAYKTGFYTEVLTRKVRPARCDGCGYETQVTIEKGSDSYLIVKMLSLAWAGAYDTAVLVSGDDDFTPAVKFLREKGVPTHLALFRGQAVADQLRRSSFGEIVINDLLRDITRGEARFEQAEAV